MNGGQGVEVSKTLFYSFEPSTDACWDRGVYHMALFSPKAPFALPCQNTSHSLSASPKFGDKVHPLNISGIPEQFFIKGHDAAALDLTEVRFLPSGQHLADGLLGGEFSCGYYAHNGSERLLVQIHRLFCGEDMFTVCHG